MRSNINDKQKEIYIKKKKKKIFIPQVTLGQFPQIVNSAWEGKHIPVQVSIRTKKHM